MDREAYRKEIDKIDNQLVELFEDRMRIAGRLAYFKKENHLPILDAGRERAKLEDAAAQSQEEFRDYTRQLYSFLFELSRSYQNKLTREHTPLTEMIRKAARETQELFPKEAVVACQGIEGSDSQIACGKLFRHADIMYFSSFDEVFSAIEEGLCRYGVIPLESGTAGPASSVYDLMMQYDFRIVRSLRLKVDRNLPEEPCPPFSIEDRENNYTRFICISKNLEIYPGADRTSLTATLPQEPGALNKLFFRLCALGINLNRLESRPLSDRDFAPMFYIDLDVPVCSPKLLQLIDELSDVTGRFSYLGSYSEMS